MDKKIVELAIEIKTQVLVMEMSLLCKRAGIELKEGTDLIAEVFTRAARSVRALAELTQNENLTLVEKEKKLEELIENKFYEL